jgi:hypothetical protein
VIKYKILKDTCNSLVGESLENGQLYGKSCFAGAAISKEFPGGVWIGHYRPNECLVED